MPSWHPFLFLVFLSWITVAQAITVYGVTGVVTNPGPSATVSTSVTATASYTGPAAFNPTVLAAPAVPNPAPPMQFTVQLDNSASNVPGLSIPQSGSFFGFSIEMSVIDQIIGRNASLINVPFLNLMGLISQRAGRVNIRVGGNTQETAVLVESIPGGLAISKDKADSSNPTETPTLIFTPEIIYMLNNVSGLVNTKWYLGLPMNDTQNLRLEVGEVAEAILGANLLGLQLGNEPDLYGSHGHRPATYAPTDYFNDFSIFTQAIQADTSLPLKSNLIAPSVASGPWTPEMVWDTGFIPAYTTFLEALAVEHYPDDNCAAAFPEAGFGPPKDPQAVFPNYLNHSSGIGIVAPYLNSSAIAQASGKPFLMFETNSASCGGFPGVSDSFGSALWGLDYGLQMAYSNFSGALLHVGGSDDTYNPFTPPPTNQTSFNQWTAGPIFYSALVMSEALGNSNQSQVIDLQMNTQNIYTPGYAIYESGTLARMVLFNYITDATGASTYTATVAVPEGVPSSVTVKYLTAPSVAEKQNITWGGQTLGGMFQVDGRLKGSESVQTVSCDTSANTCAIQVPAPAVALVFFTTNAFQESSPQAPMTFSTTAVTKSLNTATIPASVLATSNGQSGSDRSQLGSTSKGSSGALSLKPSLLASTLVGLMTFLAGGLTLLHVFA